MNVGKQQSAQSTAEGNDVTVPLLEMIQNRIESHMLTTW